MSLALIGPGAMGQALVTGWLAAGMPAEDIVVVGHDEAETSQAAATLGVQPGDLAAAGECDVVVLATKPHQILVVLEQLRPHLQPHTLVISIAAGVSLAQLATALPTGQPLARVMPNTPALVGEGMAGIALANSATDEHRQTVVQLMSDVGKAVVIPESSMHALIGLSGSGPAYIFYVAEAMIEAGVHQGLTRQQATELVNQTILGAGTMLTSTGDTATVLRERVTSPAGTTAAALRALDDAGVRAAFMSAVDAAAARSREMS